MIDRHQMMADFVVATAEMRAFQKLIPSTRLLSAQRRRAEDAAEAAERKVDALLILLRAYEDIEPELL